MDEYLRYSIQTRVVGKQQSRIGSRREISITRPKRESAAKMPSWAAHRRDFLCMREPWDFHWTGVSLHVRFARPAPGLSVPGESSQQAPASPPAGQDGET